MMVIVLANQNLHHSVNRFRLRHLCLLLLLWQRWCIFFTKVICHFYKWLLCFAAKKASRLRTAMLTFFLTLYVSWPKMRN